LTGNTVIDALLQVAGRAYDLKKAGIELAPNKKIILVTTHRRESFGRPLRNTCQAISRLAQTFSKEIQIVIPVHKNPMVKNTINEILGGIENVMLIDPLDYLPFVHLMKAAYLILTDSGGVQEEAPSLGKPVLVLRDKTERPEAVVAGTVKLVGTDEELIYAEAVKLLTEPVAYEAMSRAVNPYGDGVAAERIVQAMLYYFGATDKKPREFSTN
jgi:UDP-N-acetylglucosamine 2-epimerase (non-hydrolysing)